MINLQLSKIENAQYVRDPRMVLRAITQNRVPANGHWHSIDLASLIRPTSNTLDLAIMVLTLAEGQTISISDAGYSGTPQIVVDTVAAYRETGQWYKLFLMSNYTTHEHSPEATRSISKKIYVKVSAGDNPLYSIFLVRERYTYFADGEIPSLTMTEVPESIVVDEEPFG